MRTRLLQCARTGGVYRICRDPPRWGGAGPGRAREPGLRRGVASHRMPSPHTTAMTPTAAVRLLVLTLALIWTAGCGAFAGGARNPFAGGPQGERTISVGVRNDNFADATVYVFRGGERIRAGVVVGKGNQTFRIGWTSTRTFRAEIDLLGGGRCLTREIQMAPGDRVDLRVPLDISNDPECRPR